MFLFPCALLTHSIQTNCGPVFKDLTLYSKNFKPYSTKSRIIRDNRAVGEECFRDVTVSDPVSG